MKTPKQIDMAQGLLMELQTNFEDVKEITVLDILDTLGVCGLSLKVGDDASIQYLAELAQIAQTVK